MNTDVKSAGRILDILELLARATEPVSLKEVAADLSFPRSSTHGLLQTLVGRGYALRRNGERYALNPTCQNGPGWIGGTEANLIAVARPIMDRLRDECGETVYLGVAMRNHDVKRVAASISHQAVRYDVVHHDLAPAYCSAMGRVLLAFSPPDAIAAYLARLEPVARTPHTITNAADLAALIAAVRRQGYAVSDQEMVIGGTGIAAPVRDSSAKVVAVVNLAVVTPRFLPNRERMITAVIASGQQISLRLGCNTGGKDPSA
jgi:DNA-binding IclR family transcriptional regulator